MGYAKYYEDICESHSYDNYYERSWYSESKKINQVVFSKNSSPRSENDRIRFLKTVRQSLQYRLNLMLTASNVKTPLVKGLIFSLKYDMEKVLTDVNKEISNHEKSNIIENVLTEKEKQEYKKSLILQIFDKTIYSVSNAEVLTEDEISPVINDLSALALWYKNDDILFGTLTFDERNIRLVADLITCEFGSEFTLCDNCNNRVPIIFKHCIKCGYGLGGKNED